MEREFILQRIADMKKVDYFSPKLMRWKNVRLDGKHISQVDFEKLPAKELVDAFEKIIRRYYTQM